MSKTNPASACLLDIGCTENRSHLTEFAKYLYVTIFLFFLNDKLSEICRGQGHVLHVQKMIHSHLLYVQINN